MKTIAIDFETFYDSDRDYSIKTMGAWHYTHDPRFDPYMLSACDGQHTWAGHPSTFNWNTLKGALVLSHNRYFDELVYRRLVELGKAPLVEIAGWECTANLTAFLCNRRALAQATEHLYGVKVDKDPRKEMDGQRWEDRTPDQRARMLHYAQEDAWNCYRIWRDHSHRWSSFERALSNQTIEIGWRGVKVDWEKVDHYIGWIKGMLDETDRLLPWVAQGEKATSPLAIGRHCRTCGIPTPPVKSHDEEAFLAWEAEYSPRHPWIPCVSAHRSLNTLLSLLHSIKTRRRADGTMPFALKYFGGHTGRWSGDAGINVQNQRKDFVFRNERGLMEMDEKRSKDAVNEHHSTGKWPTWVSAVIDMRSIYIPRPGKKFIIADLAQIEPRVLHHIVGNRDLLERIASGMSIYEAFARTSMGWTGGDLKREDKARYALAKAQVIGLGYGCGWERFISVAQSIAGIDITADDPEFVEQVDKLTGATKQVSGYGKFSKECVAAFRAANPRITELWKRLDQNLKSSIGEDFDMVLPSGRTMQYRKVRREIRFRPDEDGKPKKEYHFTAEVDGRRYGFYGGALTENLVQATSRDIFGEHLLAIEREKIGNVAFHVHDEVVVEADLDTPKEEVVRVMTRTPAWIKGLPLGAEAVDASFYTK